MVLQGLDRFDASGEREKGMLARKESFWGGGGVPASSVHLTSNIKSVSPLFLQA